MHAMLILRDCKGDLHDMQRCGRDCFVKKQWWIDYAKHDSSVIHYMCL